MYSDLFQLTEPPFRLSPDPEYLFASKQHARAKAYMESTIWLADGFVVITGEIGAGKTTLIESFLAELPDDVVLAHVNQTQLSPVEFLQAVLVEFGFREFHDRKVELLAKLKDYMLEQYDQGKTLLLVVDEAQNLSHKVLEELRLLSGIEAQKEKPLRIILAGQPEMNDKLDSLRLEQLRQRVRLRFHLSTLTKRETAEYVQHRLDVAGADGRRIFDRDALDLIFRYAGGVPRLINILCDTAMLCGFSEGKDTIDVGLVNEALKELQWVEYSERFENRGRFSASHAPRGRSSGMRLVDRGVPRIAERSAPTKAAAPEPPTLTPEPTLTGRNPLQDEHAEPVNHARFDILFQDRFLSKFDLPLGRVIIGRTSDNDLQIRSRFISRHHLQIVTTDEGSVAKDLGSTNGMFIEDERIEEHALMDGDVIVLGEHKLVFCEVPGSRSGHPKAPDAQTDNAPGSERGRSSDIAGAETRVLDADFVSEALNDDSVDDAADDSAAGDGQGEQPEPTVDGEAAATDAEESVAVDPEQKEADDAGDISAFADSEPVSGAR